MPRITNPTIASAAIAHHRRQRRLMVLQVVLHLQMATIPRAPPQPRHTSILTGPRFVYEILTGSPWRIRHLFRMPKETFLDLCTDIRAAGITNSRRSTGPAVEEKLAMFLFIVAHAASNRDTQDRFQRSAETVHNAFGTVLSALYGLYHQHVYPPPDTTPEAILKQHGKFKEFVNCRGAIDGTHIHVCIPDTMSIPFRNRKGFLSQNVLAGCTLDLYFFYVLPGWQGSANDNRVLNGALAENFPLLDGRYYLADAGYQLRKGFLTPYDSTRYHLQEQARAGVAPETRQELFNLRHSQLRNAIERIFGVLKKRFKILVTPLPYDLEIQAHLVIVLAMLHNYIRRKAGGVSGEKYDPLYQETDRQLQEEFRARTRESVFSGGTRDMSFQQFEGLRDAMAQRMWEQYENVTER